MLITYMYMYKNYGVLPCATTTLHANKCKSKMTVNIRACS